MIDESIRAIILGDAATAALIATNGVYAQRLPQDVTKPCIVYSMLHGIDDLTAGSTSALKRYTIDLKVYSEKYSQMRTITQALVTLFQGLSTVQNGDMIQGSRVQSIDNDFEATLQLYSSQLDITLICKET